MSVPSREDLYWYRANLVRVIDGDTYELDIDLGLKLTQREKVRLYGYDTWEVRGEHKEKGKAATLFVKYMLEGADEIYIKTHLDRSGKYGRLLVEVFTSLGRGWQSLGEQLKANGHCKGAE